MLAKFVLLAFFAIFVIAAPENIHRDHRHRLSLRFAKRSKHLLNRQELNALEAPAVTPAPTPDAAAIEPRCAEAEENDESDEVEPIAAPVNGTEVNPAPNVKAAAVSKPKTTPKAQAKKTTTTKAKTTSTKSANKATPKPLPGSFSGDATFYDVGLGACGKTNNNGQLVAAVSHSLFDSFPGAGPNPNKNPICGKKLTATFKGKSVTVTIVDRCPGCAYGDLDLSPTAFSRLADQKLGRIRVSWRFA